ncbi:MAG: diguanylate cyclase domain-containing protein [Thermodesulfobacteriota bacterium]
MVTGISRRKTSSTDPLTQIDNRNMRYEELDRRYHGRFFAMSPSALSYLMDIDHFKEVNDTYGHLTGDEELIRLVCRIKSLLGHPLRVTEIMKSRRGTPCGCPYFGHPKWVPIRTLIP